MADLRSAYALLQPNVSLTMSKVSAVSDVISDVALELQDFTTFNFYLSDSEAQAYPSLQMYPIMCYSLVPIYCLDALGVGALPLSLTRPVLAQIYLGHITWWNDSAIFAVESRRSDAGAAHHDGVHAYWGVVGCGVHHTALSKPYAPFNITIPVSATPAWPVSRYYRWIRPTGAYGQGSAVLSPLVGRGRRTRSCVCWRMRRPRGTSWTLRERQ